MATDREMETFRRELPGLLKNAENRGKYALICGERVDSIWETREEGVNTGYERFGLERFIVQEINDKPKVYRFFRSL